MHALTVEPKTSGTARLADLEDPRALEGELILHPLAVGICGTDREILEGRYGWAPPGRSRLVLGHEAVAHVAAAPQSAQFAVGDLVVPIVRHPDPVPCSSCAVGEWDMCRNGRYTEHGIKELDGFCAQSVRMDPQYVVRVSPKLRELAVLVEPTSVVAKAWEHIEHIGRRAHWAPKTVLVTGAGPVGLLAALLGKQRNLEVYIYDAVTSGPKPELARGLGAHYIDQRLPELLSSVPMDIVLECTGAQTVVLDVMTHNARGAITCLVGLSASGGNTSADIGKLDQSIVLENDVIFGSVNANRRHYEAAAQALERADEGWLSALISRRVPLARWNEAVQRAKNDVKVLIELAS
jgi:threonine dehydrogenase-like Zn-dependent dehydrogenase